MEVTGKESASRFAGRAPLRGKSSALGTNARTDAMKLDYNDLLFSNPFMGGGMIRQEAPCEKSKLSASFILSDAMACEDVKVDRLGGVKRRLSRSKLSGSSRLPGDMPDTGSENTTPQMSEKLDAKDLSSILSWTPSKPRSTRNIPPSAASPSSRKSKTPKSQRSVSRKPRKSASKQSSNVARPKLLGIGGGAMRVVRGKKNNESGRDRAGESGMDAEASTSDDEDDDAEDEDKTQQAGSHLNSQIERKHMGACKLSPSPPLALVKQFLPEQSESLPISLPSAQMPPAAPASAEKSLAERDEMKYSCTAMLPPPERSSVSSTPSPQLEAGVDEGIVTTTSGTSGVTSSSAGPKIDTPSSASSDIPQSCTPGSIPEEFTAFLSPGNVVRVNKKPYIKMACIGRGGSSKVYRVISPEYKLFALKRVKIGSDDPGAFANYANEINLLQRLRGNPHIITLEDAEVNESEGTIQMVMELGEVDLHQLLQSHQEQAVSLSNSKVAGFGANFVRLTWQQMLEAVDAMHQERIVHGDLKPANFVFCRGALKLIDFGIAKRIGNDTVNISRESQVGTLNYMSPEAILDTGNGEVNPDTGLKGALMKLGRASDVWSLGCIMYQLAVGHTPFSHLRWVHKLKAIIDPKHEISYDGIRDAALVEVIKSCLHRDPKKRPQIAGEGGLLSDPYLHPASKTQPAVPASVVRCIVEECISVTGSRSSPDSVFAAVIQNLSGGPR